MNESAEATSAFEERLVDIPEAMRLLSLSRASIERLISMKRLTVIRPGGLDAVRLRLSEIRAYM